MSTTKAVHQCLFCPQVFGSAAEKDDHTLEHFAQETCTECNQNLIRIGNNLYTVHNAVTCIKREFKSENSHITCTTADEQYLLQDYSVTNTLQSICAEEIEIKVEQDDVKDNQHSDGQSDSIEVQEPESHQSVVETNHENDNQDTSIINEYSTKNLIASSPNNNPFMCTICGKTLTSRAGLSKHIRRNHDATVTKFKCKYCKRGFLSQSTLDIHIVCCKRKLESQGQRQLQQSLQITNDQSLMGEMNIKIEPEVIIESAASIGHNKIDSMKEGVHVNSIQGFEIESKKSNKNSLRVSGYQCNDCSKILISQKALRGHMRRVHDPIHNKNVRKKCEICCQTFSNERTLREHKVRKHSTPGTIFCKHCTTIFSTGEALLTHQEECSVGKNKNKICKCACEVCGKEFLRAINLRNHKFRVHSTPGTILCHACVKIFSTEEELLNHKFECQLKRRKYQKTKNIRIKESRVHFETLECYLCKNILKSKRSLRAHMQWNHVPIKRQNELSNDQKSMCTVCGKYLSKNGLSGHMIMHTGERPYKCLHEGCEKSFRSASGKNRHMLTHTGEKPYHCTINGCDKRFAVSLNFKQHKFKVHGISFDSQFTCPVCNKVFLLNYLLRKHLETHSV